MTMLPDRFWSKVDRTGDCWLWTASKKGEYGGFRVGNRIRRAHDVVFEVCAGPIPYGLEVCHRCDRPLCVRPSHLFLGTHAQNMADMVRKGRSSRAWTGRTHTPETIIR